MLGRERALELLEQGLNGHEADAFEGYLTSRRDASTPRSSRTPC